MNKNHSIEIGAGTIRSDAEKFPDQIFLIDIGPGPDEGVVWCDCAAPGQGMDPSDAVRYIRADADMDLDKLVSGHPAAEAELEQLRNRVGQLQDQVSRSDRVVSGGKMREALEECLEILQTENWRGDLQDDIWAALTQQPESEPIGEVGLDPNGILEPQIYSDFDINTLEVGTEFYTSPQPSAQVLEEPTEEMLLAGQQYLHSYDLRLIYKAMRSAAPSIAEKRDWPSAIEEAPPAGVDLVIIDDFSGCGPWIGRWNDCLNKYTIAQPSEVETVPPEARWKAVNRPKPPEVQS